jgi:hypothetical protein
MQLPLSSLQNLPHVPQLPPQHPHPATHYQPLNTKAFMQCSWFATLVVAFSRHQINKFTVCKISEFI